MTLTPAYGRDYRTAKAAKADWNDNKDFLVADYFSPWDGKPVNREQVDAQPGHSPVILRFNNLTKVTGVK